jgi:hypothetical protein
LMTVPLTYEEFVEDWNSPHKDFLAVNFPGQSRAEAWEGYSAVAGQLTELCAVLEEQRIHVRQRATLGDLRQALRQFKAVTLLAHYGPPWITEEDFVDAAALAAACRQEDHPIGREIAAYLARHRQQEALAQVLGFSTPMDIQDEDLESVAALAAALNGLIYEANRWYVTHPLAFRDRPDLRPWPPAWPRIRELARCDEHAMDEESERSAGHVSYWDRIGLRLHRLRIEQQFGPELLRPAPVLEFADGKWSLPQVAAAVPADFTGILDLTVCNSVAPADVLRLTHRDCQILASRYLVDLMPALFLYTMYTGYLQHQWDIGAPVTYLDAYEYVTEAARRELEAEAPAAHLPEAAPTPDPGE